MKSTKIKRFENTIFCVSETQTAREIQANQLKRWQKVLKRKQYIKLLKLIVDKEQNGTIVKGDDIYKLLKLLKDGFV